MLTDCVIEQLQAFEPELIFFDIDGTLLNTQGQFSLQLKQQLKRLQTKGVKLAIASGRPAIAAQFIFDELPIIDAGLFCTGAELYDPSTKQHIEINALDKKELATLCKAVVEQDIYCECYTQGYYSIEYATEITKIHSQHLRVSPQQTSIERLMEGETPITKLLIGIDQRNYGDKLTPLADQFPQFEFAFAHFLPKPDWLFASVISPKACKKQGFKKLTEIHRVDPTKVMSFGDSHSDTTFLQLAGLGVAMGNASPTVKACANISTLSADDDGVAVALNYLYNDG